MTELRSGQSRRPPHFELTGGAVPLDFVNTLDDRFSDHPKELLTSYADLACFAEDTGILEPSQLSHLRRLSHESPKEAEHALHAAIELREAIYGVIWAIVTKQSVPRPALARLNQFVQLAAQHLSLVHGDGKFAWQFEDQRNDLRAPVWHIARAAADLLASDQLQFVRACASESCQWLFLDISKNHRRRWCDMTKCGNRAKARAFYSRQKCS